MEAPFSIHLRRIAPNSRTRRQREEEAVDALVKEVFGDSAVRLHDALGAPYIAVAGRRAGEYISISHSRTTAALAFYTGPVGIDIEEPRRQLNNVAARILSHAECEYYGSYARGYLHAWTMKEALYKASRALVAAEIDFSKQLILPAESGGTATVFDATGERRWKFATEVTDLADGQALAAVWLTE